MEHHQNHLNKSFFRSLSGLSFGGDRFSSYYMLAIFAIVALFLYWIAFSPFLLIDSTFHHVEYLFRAHIKLAEFPAFLKDAFILNYGEHCYRPISEWLIYIPLSRLMLNDISAYTWITLCTVMIFLISTIPLLYELTGSKIGAFAALLILAVTRAGNTQLQYFVITNSIMADTAGVLAAGFYAWGLRNGKKAGLWMALILAICSFLSKENLILMPLFLLWLLFKYNGKHKDIRRKAIKIFVLITFFAMIPISSRIYYLFRGITADSSVVVNINEPLFHVMIKNMGPFFRGIELFVPDNIMNGFIYTFELHKSIVPDTAGLILSTIVFLGLAIYRKAYFILIPSLIWMVISTSPYILNLHRDWPHSSAIGMVSLISIVLIGDSKRIRLSSRKLMNADLAVVIFLIFSSAFYSAQILKAETFESVFYQSEISVLHRRMIQIVRELKPEENTKGEISVDLTDFFKDMPKSIMQMETLNGIPGMIRFALKKPHEVFVVKAAIRKEYLIELGGKWEEKRLVFPGEDSSVYLTEPKTPNPEYIFFSMTSGPDNAPEWKTLDY